MTAGQALKALVDRRLAFKRISEPKSLSWS
jgi:hypothetical protein